MATDKTLTIHPKSIKEWRDWLRKNHKKEKKVGLIKYKKHTGKPTLSHLDSMKEAICWGWIDTTIKKLDEDRYMRSFPRRSDKSKWSKNTISYAEQMIKDGRMQPEGLKRYKEGKSRPLLQSLAKDHPPPKELIEALNKNKKAKQYFDTMAPSAKRIYIAIVERAKLPETKARKVKEIVDRCSKGLKYGQKLA